MIALCGAPFGAAFGGLLAGATSIRAEYLVMAIGVVGSLAIGWRQPLHEGTPAPSGHVPEPAAREVPA
jgi:hypothetical protein